MLLIFFLDELNERDEEKKLKAIRQYSLAPLAANLQLNDIRIYENQKTIIIINEKYKLVEKPLSIEMGNIRENCYNFEMKILEKCGELFEAVNYDGDEVKSNKQIRINLEKRGLYGDDIANMYVKSILDYNLYSNILHILNVCHLLLEQEKNMIHLGIFTDKEINLVRHLETSCSRYVEILDGIIPANNITTQYRYFLDEKYRLLDYFRGNGTIN